MSDFYLSVCPADPTWQHLMNELAPDAEDITVIWNEKINVVEGREPSTHYLLGVPRRYRR